MPTVVLPIMGLFRNAILPVGKDLPCTMHKRKTNGEFKDKNSNFSYFHLVGETGLTDVKQLEDSMKLHIIK